MDEELFVWALIGLTGPSLPNSGFHSSHCQPPGAICPCPSGATALLCWARAAPGVPGVLPLSGAVGSAQAARLCPAAPAHPTPQGDVSYGCTPLAAVSPISSSHWVLLIKSEMHLGISFFQKGQHKAHLEILCHSLHAERSPCRMKKLFVLWGWFQSQFAYLYKIYQWLILKPPTQTISPCIFYFSDL